MAGSDRLVVINKVSLIQPLPVAYQERLERIPGIKEVTHNNWFGGIYQDPKNFFAQLAIDDDTFHSMYPEFLISDDQWKAYKEDREGAIVGVKLAKRFGWKLGDRIPIKGTIFPGTWEFNIRAIYTGKRPADDTTQFWFHYKYLEERENQYWHGLVGWYVVKVDSPDNAVRIAKAIDTTFANSPWETKTDTEQAFAASFAKQMGNISFLIMSIGAVVFFTLLLVAGNTMATAVRERIRELAVLKAVGFSDTFVLLLVVFESVVVAAIGGGVGLVLAKLLTLNGDPTGGMLPFFYLPAAAMALGAVLALAVGFAAGIVPAYSAGRLKVVDALRSV